MTGTKITTILWSENNQTLPKLRTQHYDSICKPIGGQEQLRNLFSIPIMATEAKIGVLKGLRINETRLMFVLIHHAPISCISLLCITIHLFIIKVIFAFSHDYDIKIIVAYRTQQSGWEE